MRVDDRCAVLKLLTEIMESQDSSLMLVNHGGMDQCEMEEVASLTDEIRIKLVRHISNLSCYGASCCERGKEEDAEAGDTVGRRGQHGSLRFLQDVYCS